MVESQAQVVLLVRAFEEADREGRLLTSYARATATRRALRVTGLDNWPRELGDADSPRYSETVFRRARVLFESLDRKIPGLRGLIRVAQFGATTAPAVFAVAILAGLLTNVLGPRRQINLLSFPLLGILAWNLLIYVMLLAPLVLKRESGRRMADIVPWLADRFLRGALWRRLHGWSIGHVGSAEAKRIAVKGLLRFAALWQRIAGSLLAARVRRTLHLGAAAIVVGAVAGMYVRGLGFEYHATWESTWLDADTVRWILGVVLGPAAAILGVDIPDLVPLRGPEGGGAAALWIHLYAVTALLYVVVPRMALALFASWRCSLLADLNVDLTETYFRRVFTEWRGATRHVEIVPYGFSPAAAAVDALKTLLHDYFGARADIRVRNPLAYGDDVVKIDTIPPSPRLPWARSSMHEEERADPERERCHVVLFNLAQSPESEVHGSFLEELMQRLESVRGRLLVVVDGSAYSERVADPERSNERFRAWERVVREAGPVAIELDPERPVDDDAVHALGEAIWNREEAVEAAG